MIKNVMKSFNIRHWGAYVIGVTFLSAIINLIFSIGSSSNGWIMESVWLGLIVGTGLYFWDLKYPLKK